MRLVLQSPNVNKIEIMKTASATHNHYFFVLLFYRGKSVLNQKSELQRALEKHKESQSKKELEQQRLECRTPFERIIEERAKRLETVSCPFNSVRYPLFPSSNEKLVEEGMMLQ